MITSLTVSRTGRSLSVPKVDFSELPEWTAAGHLPVNIGSGRRLFATELQRTAVDFGKLQVFAARFGQDCRGLWQGKPLSFKCTAAVNFGN
jgi:hypothetical protein